MGKLSSVFVTAWKSHIPSFCKEDMGIVVFEQSGTCSGKSTLKQHFPESGVDVQAGSVGSFMLGKSCHGCFHTRIENSNVSVTN